MSWFRNFGAGVRIIQNAGVAMPARPSLNFIGAVVTDDAVNGRTNVAINGLGGVVLSGTPTTGQVIKATGPTTATWQNR